MVPLTTLEYELDENLDKVLSRLKWAVEEVELNWLDDLNKWNTGPATHKDWIGEINKKSLNFKLKEPGSLFKQKIKVMLKGNLELRASTTNVKIKLGLDNISFIWILMVYIISALSISDVFTNDEFNSYLALGIFLLAFPILGTYLLTRRMKRAERKLDKLFR
jgi:hypothetical protein